jgi:thiol-disulfide isomerase/thioredoxin
LSFSPKVAVIGGALLLASVAGVALFLAPAEGDGPATAPIAGINISPGALYATRFPDTAGHVQELGQWQQKLLVINFWATWCAPCREEMPILDRMQQKYGGNGLQIVGIAVDSTSNVINFAKSNPMTYPLLPDERLAIEFSKRLGNRLGLLPHTAIVRPGGDIIFLKLGVLKEAELDALIQRNIPK